MKKIYLVAIGVLSLSQSAHAIICSTGCTVSSCKDPNTFRECWASCKNPTPKGQGSTWSKAVYHIPSGQMNPNNRMSIKNCIASAQREPWMQGFVQEESNELRTLAGAGGQLGGFGGQPGFGAPPQQFAPPPQQFAPPPQQFAPPPQQFFPPQQPYVDPQQQFAPPQQQFAPQQQYVAPAPQAWDGY